MSDVTGLELRSTASGDGKLRLTLEEVTLSPPADDEVIVRVEAAPINPSDLGLLLGPADVASMAAGGSAERPELTFDIPQGRLGSIKARLDQSLPVGNEGGGTVIAAGAGAGAKALEGRVVGMMGGAMYTQYRKLKARDVVPVPEGTSPRDASAMFVNPLTALSFVETARMEGHKAIVHLAAASNLGQMLVKICAADGVPLVNVVRSEAQVDLLKGLGAEHVLNSTDSNFRKQLVDVIAATEATLCFDPIGGGSLGSDVVQAMEQAAVRNMSEFSRYGSDSFKQLYIYGALDLAPTTLNRLAFGFQWAVSGFLLTPWMKKAGAEVVGRMRQRVVDELTTTFASGYTATIGLAEALKPEVVAAYEKKATGEKYLIDPTK